MTNKDNIEFLIDLSCVDATLSTEDLEKLSMRFCEEISDLVEESQLLRESKLPDTAKPALGSFLPTIKGKVNAANLPKLVGSVRDRFGAKPVRLAARTNGDEFTIDAGKSGDIDKALNAFLKKITSR